MGIDSRFLLILLLLLCLLPVPAAAEEDVETDVPYPDRTFLYIVDCSASMEGYRDALNTGRQMLSDLLPKEKTIVIAFAGTAEVVPSGILSFGGETSVLAGVQKADEVLNTLWSADPARQVTTILFSDMNSSVQAVDGVTPLTDASYDEEAARLLEIQERWNQYTQAGNFNYYSLNWSVPPLPNERTVFFSPISSGSGAHQPLDTQSENFTREILTACVEAYACVLTGSDGTRWTEAEASTSAGTPTVSQEESYRTFLYLDQAPDGIECNGRTVKLSPPWTTSSGGCVLMIENADSGLYTLYGVSTDAQILCLTIPQPKITVKVSPEPVVCFDNVTISIGTVAGGSYLGYDDSNSSCLLNISGTSDDRPQVLSGDYNEDLSCYEVAFQPDRKGEYQITLYYTVYGDDRVLRTIPYPLDVGAYYIRLDAQTQREFNALRRQLQRISAGEEITFRLSDYYHTSYRQLAFVIEEPEDPTLATWEPGTDNTGTVTVRGLKEGETTLRCTINYYEEGIDMPDNSQELILKITVLPGKNRPLPVWLIVTLSGAVVAIAVIIILLIRRKKKPTL